MMTTEKTTGFGLFLRNQRRARDIPIETVSQKTKIRVEVLQYIENEDLARLPSSTFVKGFVRAYAEAVGADVQEALRLFEASCVAHVACDMIGAPEKKRSSFWRSFVLICLVLALLALISISIARHMADRQASPTPPEAKDAKKSSSTGMQTETAAPASTTEAPASMTQGAAAAPTPPPASSEDIPPAASPAAEAPAPPEADANATANAPENPIQTPPQDKLVLQIEAVELTWLRVTSDGRVVKEVTLNPEERMTFEAEKGFELIIGNAGGVQLTLNGRPLGYPGKRGKVVSLKLP